MAIRSFAPIKAFAKMDEETIAAGLPADLLMENAGNAMGTAILSEFSGDYHFHVFCGKGNNGGDGLVVARFLAKHGREVTLYFLGKPSQKRSKCWQEKHTLLSHFQPKEIWEAEKNILRVKRHIRRKIKNVVVDGLFGTGLSKPLAGAEGKLISFLNAENVVKVALDLPSGLQQALNGGSLFKADLTLTVQMYKDLFLYPWYAKFAGRIKPVSIDFLPKIVAKYRRSIEVFGNYKKPDKTRYDHKYTRGRSLILAGSKKYPGAAELASAAANQSGASYLQVLLPGGNTRPHALASEVISFDPDRHDFFTLDLFDKHKEEIANAKQLLFGPGVERHVETTEFLRLCLETRRKKIIIDADGLWHARALGDGFIRLASKHEMVLTPHLGEFANLMGLPSENVKKDLWACLDRAREKYHCAILLKDAFLYLWSAGGERYFPRPNRYLSKAGSGDILAGMLLGKASLYDSLEDALIQGILRYHEKADGIIKEHGEDAPIHFMLGGFEKR